MQSNRDLPSQQTYLLNAVAPSGRGIERGVLSVAQAIAGRAISYAGKFINDPCVAANRMEEDAATVSEVIRAEEAAQLAPIRDVRL